MVYKEQELGQFLTARDEASKFIKEKGLKKRDLSFEEAHLLQASSHLLTTANTFYGLELCRLTNSPPGVVYPILRRFETEQRLLQSGLEDIDPHGEGRPPRRLYKPTPVGEVILALFQQPPKKD